MVAALTPSANDLCGTIVLMDYLSLLTIGTALFCLLMFASLSSRMFCIRWRLFLRCGEFKSQAVSKISLSRRASHLHSFYWEKEKIIMLSMPEPRAVDVLFSRPFSHSYSSADWMHITQWEKSSRDFDSQHRQNHRCIYSKKHCGCCFLALLNTHRHRLTTN